MHQSRLRWRGGGGNRLWRELRLRKIPFGPERRAWLCCGPRSDSASAAEYSVACAPLRHVRRRSDGSKSGRSSLSWHARMPLSPSTITARASVSEADTSAIRAAGCEVAMCRTHSAPARVLPKPRPAQISQIRHSPSGGSCSGRAHIGQNLSSLQRLVSLNPARKFSHWSGSEASSHRPSSITVI